jgi:hypothetical protein
VSSIKPVKSYVSENLYKNDLQFLLDRLQKFYEINVCYNLPYTEEVLIFHLHVLHKNILFSHEFQTPLLIYI